MSRCTAIKPSGERCKARAIEGSEWCWNHNPDHAGERRRHGAKGGKRAGRGRPQSELADIKRRLSDLADDVLAERVDKGVAAVASQILNVYLRAVSTEIAVREQTELVARLEALEDSQEQRKGDRRWGA